MYQRRWVGLYGLGESAVKMEKLKKNWLLILITLATIGLGVIAIITAIRLNSLGTKPVAPTAPKPAPALEPSPTPGTPCTLNFCITETTPTPTTTVVVTTTPTPTGRVTVTPTPTGAVTTTPQPTPTPITSCYNECLSSSDCRSGLICQQISGVKRCLNTKCETESDCVCNKNCWEVCGHDSECPADHSCIQIGASKRCVRYQPCTTEGTCCDVPTKPPTVTPTTYVAKVTVPEAGFIPPTFLMLGGGIGAVIASLLLLVF